MGINIALGFPYNREMLLTKIVEEIKTHLIEKPSHFIFNNSLPDSVPFMR
jgi:hypothetical protein